MARMGRHDRRHREVGGRGVNRSGMLVKGYRNLCEGEDLLSPVPATVCAGKPLSASSGVPDRVKVAYVNAIRVQTGEEATCTMTR